MSEEGAALIFKSIPERIGAQAAERPTHPALIQDERVVSYGDLDAAMDRIAATLQARGVRPRDVVAVCAANSIAYVEVFCGALRAGVAVAPLAPSSTPQSLERMVADCGAKFLFVDAAAADHLAPVRSAIAAPLVSLDDDAAGEPLRRWLAPEGSTPAPIEIDPRSAFNIIYSSGTTGTPKGIVQPHAMRTPWEAPGAAFGYGTDAVAIISTGLYSNTTLCSLFPALGGGATVVLMAKFDVGEFLELSERWRVTHAMLVPVQYQRIMAHPEFHQLRSVGLQDEVQHQRAALGGAEGGRAEALAGRPDRILRHDGRRGRDGAVRPRAPGQAAHRRPPMAPHRNPADR